MSYGVLSVKRGMPCPICGKPDYCGKMPSSEFPNTYLSICMRTSGMNREDSLTGYDGNEHIVVGVSRSGNLVFEEKNQFLQHSSFKNSSGCRTLGKRVHNPVKSVSESLPPRCPEELDKIYRDFLSLLILEDHHRKYLNDEGITDALIRRYNLRSLPENDYFRYNNKKYICRNDWRRNISEKLAKKYGTLEGIPGFFINSNDSWTFSGPGGILFPQQDLCSNIYRLRVRVDHRYYDSEHKRITKEQFDSLKDKNSSCYDIGKYLNFSSYSLVQDANGNYINRYRSGCSSGNNLGFYIPDGADVSIIYGTEGEKKSIIGSNILKAGFINIPGVNSYAKLMDMYCEMTVLEWLKKAGVEVFVVMYDSDKNVNEHVLKNEKNLVKMLLNAGIDVAVGYWDPALGKGIDDLLLAGYKPKYEFICA